MKKKLINGLNTKLSVHLQVSCKNSFLGSRFLTPGTVCAQSLWNQVGTEVLPSTQTHLVNVSLVSLPEIQTSQDYPDRFLSVRPGLHYLLRLLLFSLLWKNTWQDGLKGMGVNFRLMVWGDTVHPGRKGQEQEREVGGHKPLSSGSRVRWALVRN